MVLSIVVPPAGYVTLDKPCNLTGPHTYNWWCPYLVVNCDFHKTYMQKCLLKGTLCPFSFSHPVPLNRDVFSDNPDSLPRHLLERYIFLVPELDLQRGSVSRQPSRSIQAPPSHKAQPRSKGQNRTGTPASVLNRETASASQELTWPEEQHERGMFSSHFLHGTPFSHS